MRYGLLIGFIVSVGFNFLAFGGFAFSFRQRSKEVKEEAKIVEMIFDPADQLQPPPPEEPEDEEPPAENQAVEEAVASLPEPPPSVQIDSGITEVFRPTPPVPPRPDALTKALAPTRKGGGGSGTGGTGLGMNVFSIADLDRQPTTRVAPNPVYPYELRRQGIKGNVRVRFAVDESGSVYQVDILESSHPEFSRAVREAVMKMKWTPGTKNGRPVRFLFERPYAFNL